jgi:hypothetical protein
MAYQYANIKNHLHGIAFKGRPAYTLRRTANLPERGKLFQAWRGHGLMQGSLSARLALKVMVATGLDTGDFWARKAPFAELSSPGFGRCNHQTA